LFVKSAKSLLSAKGETQMGRFTVRTNAGKQTELKSHSEERFELLVVARAEKSAQEMYETTQTSGLAE
jgi:hypothetical protein